MHLVFHLQAFSEPWSSRLLVARGGGGTGDVMAALRAACARSSLSTGLMAAMLLQQRRSLHVDSFSRAVASDGKPFTHSLPACQTVKDSYCSEE